MKLINIIFAVLSMAVLTALSSCMDAKEDQQHLGGTGVVTIQLFLSGTVRSSSGEYLKDIRVEDKDTGNHAMTDERGSFVLQSSKTVKIGNLQETVYLQARDGGGYFTPRTVGVVIGEWASGQATISNIQIVMEPVSSPSPQ